MNFKRTHLDKDEIEYLKANHIDNSFLLPDLFNDLTKQKFNCCRAVRPKRKECYRALLATCFLLVSHLTYSSSLMMETVLSSEMSVDIYQTTQCYI
jgi:hypothetical protein